MRRFLVLVLLLWVGFGVAVAWRNRATRGEAPIKGRRLVARGGCRGNSSPSSVELGLQWLARHQRTDGSWTSSDFAASCSRTRCDGTNLFVDDVRTTSLALLAFTGAGYTPQNRASYVDPIDGTTRRFGVCVARANKWLISRQAEDGAIGACDSRVVARQALATLALTESFRITNAVAYRAPAQKAVHYLERARGSDGGWGFAPGVPLSDPSVTRRVLLALVSARGGGLETVQRDAPLGPLAWLVVSPPWQWTAMLDEPLRPMKGLCADQETRLRGCGEGSYAGPGGRVHETARALIHLEMGYRYSIAMGPRLDEEE